ncbi:MAG: hypothetical protein JO112_08300, partial [Planctomycetes bacterium]|nr:hypothetical protein [Planctomycetota bacterium]
MNSPSLHRWLRNLRERRARKPRSAAHKLFVKLRIEILENRWLPAPLVVTTTADSGAGSLRQEIMAVNSGMGSVIDFSIPTTDLGYQSGTGTWLIKPATPLPAITNPVTVDGTSQMGYAAKPLIELDGESAGVGNGLEISGGASTVEGLAINRFSGSGIQLDTFGGDTVQKNYLGTNVTGTTGLGNQMGVFVHSSSNTIGGTAAGSGNLISGNTLYGIDIDPVVGVVTANVVQGNFIGTDIHGTSSVPNYFDGIYLSNTSHNTIGGNAAGATTVLTPGVGSLSGQATPYPGNLISGNGGPGASGGTDNANGVDIEVNNIVSSSFNLVEGNYVGTDVNGTAALGNTEHGVYIAGTSSNTVGGTALGAGNLISANKQDGIGIFALTN